MKPEDHLEHLRDLLDIELEADRNRFRQEIQQLSLKERIQRGFTWSPLQVVKTGIMVGDKAYVILERPSGKRKDSSIKAGSPVRYYTTVPGVERPEVNGVVHWIRDRQIKVILGGPRLPKWHDVRGQAVDLEFDENSYKEMRQALDKAMKAKGRQAAMVRILTGREFPDMRATSRLSLPAHLNKSQREAIELVEAAKDVAIIHGPPGTGKTTTLVAAIEHICTKEPQVMVCAPSNVAVDLLAERLHKQGLHVVRTGHISRVSEELLDLTLDAQVAAHPEHKQIKRIKIEAADIRKRASVHKRTFTANDRRERAHAFRQAGELDGWARQIERRILTEVLDSAQVICCTLTGAGAEFLRERKFKTLVVDEAAQALEPAMWIPLQRARRLIMAGDPFQLPPTVKSRRAQRQGLGVTMMERLLPDLPEFAALLTVQYRMHGAIMGFSNEYFYEGKLQADPSVAHRNLPFGDEPAVRFIDTAGAGFEEKMNPETNSRFNDDEYLLLATYLHQYADELKPSVLAEEGLEPIVGAVEPLRHKVSIALISPYREQVEQMRREIADDPLLSQLDISAHTIDGFQGQERDWVLLSLVRDNDKGEIGFLKDYRRMNVAMTRARMQLVVIGNSATIGGDPFYGKFLEYVEEHGDYDSAFTYMSS